MAWDGTGHAGARSAVHRPIHPLTLTSANGYDAAIVGTDGFDGFGHQPLGFIGCLRQVALLRMFPSAGTEILGHAGVFLSGSVGV